MSLSSSVETARAEDRREEWRLSALMAAIYAIVGVQLPFFPLWLHSRGLGADEIAAILSAPPLLRILTMLLVRAAPTATNSTASFWSASRFAPASPMA